MSDVFISYARSAASEAQNVSAMETGVGERADLLIPHVRMRTNW